MRRCSYLNFSSVQLWWTLCNPMDCSTTGLPIYHQLQFTQTHVNWVSDAIQTSHPLSSPSPPAFNLQLGKLLILWDSCYFPANTDWLSVQFSRSVMSDFLWQHEPQHARPPCPSPTPVYSNSCPLSRWCHPTISSSVIPLSSCLQSFPASGSFHWVRSSH